MAGANLGDVLSPEARDARLRSLAASGGGTVETVGHSVQGRPLLAARLPVRRSCRSLADGGVRNSNVTGGRGGRPVLPDVGEAE